MAVKRKTTGVKKAKSVSKKVEAVKEVKVKKETILFRVYSGSFMDKDGVMHDSSDPKTRVFEALERDVPKAFRDVIRPVEQRVVVPQRVIKFEKVEVPATEEEKAEDGFEQLYNVINLNGDSVNPDPVSEAEADKLLSLLN